MIKKRTRDVNPKGSPQSTSWEIGNSQGEPSGNPNEPGKTGTPDGGGPLGVAGQLLGGMFGSAFGPAGEAVGQTLGSLGGTKIDEGVNKIAPIPGMEGGGGKDSAAELTPNEQNFGGAKLVKNDIRAGRLGGQMPQEPGDFSTIDAIRAWRPNNT